MRTAVEIARLCAGHVEATWDSQKKVWRLYLIHDKRCPEWCR